MDKSDIFRLVECGNVVQRVLARAWLDADSGLFPRQNAAQHKALIEDALAYTEEQTKQYKAMADELADALQKAMEWNWLDDDADTICEAPFIKAVLAKYNSMKGEE